MIAALSKQRRVELKQTLAIVAAAAGAKADAIRSAVQEYLEEMFPEVAESREAFIKMSSKILEKEAGKIQSLADYKVLKI